MDRNIPQLRWLDSEQAVVWLQELSGCPIGRRELLSLCEAERCRVYVDCSFASGPEPADQLLVGRIKGAGYGELLEAGEGLLSDCGESDGAISCVKGVLIVRGAVWVYGRAGGLPRLEEGIWRIDLRQRRRPLAFKPGDICQLAARLAEAERDLPSPCFGDGG